MFYCDCQKFNLTPVVFLFFDSWWQAEEYLLAALNQEYGKLQKRILSQVYFRDFVHRYRRAFKNEAPKFSKIYHTLAITIYHYCNLDLVVTIVKIIQNILENAKNKNNILWKIRHMWRRWGTLQNFFLAFIDELEK